MNIRAVQKINYIQSALVTAVPDLLAFNSILSAY